MPISSRPAATPKTSCWVSGHEAAAKRIHYEFVPLRSRCLNESHLPSLQAQLDALVAESAALSARALKEQGRDLLRTANVFRLT